MRFLLLAIFIFCTWFANLSTYGQSADGRVFRYQDHHSVFGKNNISLSLFPLINNGFEINYDRRIIERHWVKLAPSYFRRESYRESASASLRQVQGYGFKFQHKYFPHADTEKQFGLFVSYGPSYQYFDITTNSGLAVSFDKIGFECVIGMRRVFQNVFYFEIYAGLASNFLTIRLDETGNWRDVLKNHSAMWLDYAKTGNFITFGFNVGVLF